MAKNKKASPAKGGSKKKGGLAATILWSAAAVAGGVAVGTAAEALFEPQNVWVKTAVNGGTAGLSAGLMSLAVPSRSKVMLPLVNGGLAAASGAGLSVLGAGKKLAEWKNALMDKLGTSSMDSKVERLEAQLAQQRAQAESREQAYAQPQITVVRQEAPKQPPIWERILGSVVEGGVEFAKEYGLKALGGSGATRQMPRLARVF